MAVVAGYMSSIASTKLINKAHIKSQENNRNISRFRHQKSDFDIPNCLVKPFSLLHAQTDATSNHITFDGSQPVSEQAVKDRS